MSALTELRTSIEATVRTSQRGMAFRAGDRLVRGVRAVRVTRVDAGSIQWLDTASGEESTTPRAEFVSKAINRLPSKVVAPDSVLDAAWDVAGARGIPPRERAQVLYAFVSAAETSEDRGVIRGWIDVLIGEEEPERLAERKRKRAAPSRRIGISDGYTSANVRLRDEPSK